MAFFQETRPAREPFLRAPASVLILIGLLVAAHLWRIFGSEPMAILERYALDPAVYSNALHASGASHPSLWALLIPPFSHMFLHASLTHLGFNCIWLLVFGSVVGRRFGAVGFYLFFIVCGLAGAAAFVLMDWGDSAGAIGASGAISGLMGAGIRMLRLREPWLQGATLPLVPLNSNQVLLYSVLWLIVNFAMGIIGIGPTGEAESIAWQAHVGGYLAGLLLAGPFDLYFGPRLGDA